MRRLVVEVQNYHGQLVIPLVEQMLRNDEEVTLLVSQDHRDLDSFCKLKSLWPLFRLETTDFQGRRATISKLLSIPRNHFDHVLFSTVTPDRWFLPLLFSLRGCATAFVVNRLNESPSPAYPAWKGWLNCTASLAVCISSQEVFVLSEILLESMNRLSPCYLKSKFRCFQPLLGDLQDSFKPEGPVNILVPGGVIPSRRNYQMLIESLSKPALPAVDVHLVGTTRDMDVRLVKNLKPLPNVKVHLAQWMDNQALAEAIGRCHYILPLIGPTCEVDYKNYVAPSAFFWAHGLGKPMILHDSLSSVYRHPCFSYTDANSLGTCLLKGAASLQDGSYQQLLEATRSLRVKISMDNAKVLRRLI